ncbi:MAG: hypothetical protein CVU42_03175 [Chloroflexi bacterium HGW-Chloroflexi-4]|jgi:predicted RNA methylase|nr:MAG: hypothetical protein CVU42_03175 [Chloroflexi bacterium HGW-Chloroflexi-4]
MEVNISYLPDDQIVVVKTHGDADAKSSGEMVKSIMLSMKEHRSLRCLLDHTEIHFVTGKTLEVFYRPDEIKKSGMPMNVKLAAVIPEIYREHFKFLETVCQNRGISYRIFESNQSALNWLKM